MPLDEYMGFWQILLHDENQETFNISILNGLFKSRRMPRGCRDTTTHFVGVMNHVLGATTEIGDIFLV